MGKVSKKKRSKNIKPTQKLSDIVPELAYYDTAKKQVSHSLFLTKARITARYSKEKNLSRDTKSKIRSFFSSEHLKAVTYMLDFLLGIPDLSRDERNRWQNKLADFYDKVKDLLFESLDNNVSNMDKFNELVREEFNIHQRLAADAGTYQGGGTIDKKTRVVKFPEPAKTRHEIEPQEKDGQDKTDVIPTLTEDEAQVLNYLNDEFPQVRYQRDIEDAVGQSRKTIKAHLDKFKEYRFVSLPDGKKKGCVITSSGIDYIKEHFS